MTDPSELRRDPEAAAEMAANAVLRYLHGCNLEGDQSKKEWLAKVFEKVKAKELNH